MADAEVLKTFGTKKPCRFESGYRYHFIKNMRNHDLEKLLDNLRMYNLTGDEEYKQSVLDRIDCVYRCDNSIIGRSQRILERNGFDVIEEGIMTKRGIITLPSSNPINGPII
jgi:hypothetical protein